LKEDASGLPQPLQDQIIDLIASGLEAQMLINPVASSCGARSIFQRGPRALANDRAVVLVDEKRHAGRATRPSGQPDPMVPVLTPHRAASFRDPPAALPPRELVFNNGLGGFTPDGREYVITLQPKQTTPAPWVNVIANPVFFGTVVSESGGAYTGSRTVTSSGSPRGINDPVTMRRAKRSICATSRADNSGRPRRRRPAATPYVIRHGFGYTVFEHTEHGIASELWIYVRWMRR